MATSSAQRSRRHIADIDAVRTAVGIDQILGAHRCAPLRKGRTACPIHEGRNATCFAVRDNEHFVCFNCGARGDVVDLERLLGGGTVGDALRRLADRHRVAIGHVNLAAERRRERRRRRLNRWYTRRCNEWTETLVRAEQGVRGWQGDPANADDAWWDELHRRCSDRDRAEAMVETFRGLRTIEQRANAYAIEQRGLVVLPGEWEASCA